MAFGLTAAGFIRKRLEDIKAGLEADVLSAFGTDSNITADGVFGKLVGIFSKPVDDVWQLAEAVYNAYYPDTAVGIPLDRVASMVGVKRNPATYSEVVATLTGDAGTVIPGGSVCSVSETGARFVLVAAATIPVGGSISALFRAEMTGPVLAPATKLDAIETPVAGWTGVTNPLDADPGHDQETDTEFRKRRAESLNKPGASTVEAIRAALRELDGVIDALVIENDQDVPDGDARPPHSVEAIVDGATDQLVAETLWLSKAGGIQLVGNTMVAVEDSMGYTHNVRFSRPTDVNIWLEVDITRNPEETFPATGLADILANLDAYGETLVIGGDVIVTRLYGVIHKTPGISDVTIRIGTAPAPVAANNIPIGNTARAKFDTSRITVADVTP